MPNIIIDARQTPQDIRVEDLVSGMQTLAVKISILNSDFQKEYKDVELIKIPLSSQIPEEYLEDKDIFITLNPNISTKELNSITKKGIVPLMHKNFGSLGFKTFKPIEEDGNSFLFEDWNNWAVFAALVRCLENYEFPYDWKNIIHSVKNLQIEI